MGGTFKSIYLAQGRKNANSQTFGKNYMPCILLDNHQLKDLPSVLLYLKERPEEQPDAYFKEDIYISPKFN